MAAEGTRKMVAPAVDRNERRDGASESDEEDGERRDGAIEDDEEDDDDDDENTELEEVDGTHESAGVTAKASARVYILYIIVIIYVDGYQNSVR